MAKTKKAKKQENIDLNSKPEKVTEDQQKRIRDVVEKINNTTMSVGQIETRKHQALHFLAGVNDELQLIQDELVTMYGTNDVDIQTGEIKYSTENGQTDKKD